ncbi:hypothetical protein [Halobacillus litoralis]|uniref:hypothetical protein n=1 Tax=Halobacillus litoralis TaxID=45668 RepID=UPI001CFC58BD|nr:hypothetical protein [Halobacillus litoralis]
MPSNKDANSDRYYLFVVLLFWMLLTINTFFVEAEWFDFLFYTASLLGGGLFVVIQFKNRKFLITLLAVLLFIAYAYELIAVPVP